ncbi:hypothetical protein GCM10009123_21760 [Kangiella japonica]|uniref:Uncharacterized protein n=1 Tax=Kangiella japonica TaxID=647384 RepID=A0ABN0T7A6_9GAMM
MLSKLEDLESLINTLVSEVSEEFVDEYSCKADKLFFEEDNQKTLYYKEDVQAKIKSKYDVQLKKSSIRGLEKSIGKWFISSPVFIKKEKNKITWASAVEPEFELYSYKVEAESSYLDTNPHLKAYSTVNHLNRLYEQLMATKIEGRTIVTEYKGRDLFEVIWTTNLSTAQNLTSPKIVNIKYNGNTLSDEDGQSI